MEACRTSHHWARELTTLGHQVKLMPPTYMKAYVRGNKNDAVDAEAICEAVLHKSPEDAQKVGPGAEARSVFAMSDGG
jgi:transposase